MIHAEQYFHYLHTYLHSIWNVDCCVSRNVLADAVSGEAADEKRREVRGKFLGGVHKPPFSHRFAPAICFASRYSREKK